MISILCLKWGDKYGPAYVNRLYNQCKEFIKLDFKFYCATDNSKKLNSDIKILDLNDYSIPIGKYGGQRQGKIFTAEKVKIIADERFYGTKVLLLDLDLLILKDLTNYLEKYNPKKIAFCDAWWYPEKFYRQNYGRIRCKINSSFLYTFPENASQLKKQMFSKFYDYYCLKFYTLDRTVEYNFKDYIEIHKDKKLIFNYNIKKTIKKPNYKICVFNNSHGIGEDLHEVNGWAKDYWLSYD